MLKVPPPGMASAALKIRLRKTCLIWSGWTLIAGGFCSSSVWMATRTGKQLLGRQSQNVLQNLVWIGVLFARLEGDRIRGYDEPGSQCVPTRCAQSACTVRVFAGCAHLPSLHRKARGAFDRLERVIDLMRQGSSQAAQGRKFFRLDQAPLRLLALVSRPPRF